MSKKELYCLMCREPTESKLGTFYTTKNKKGLYNIKGECRNCGKTKCGFINNSAREFLHRDMQKMCDNLSYVLTPDHFDTIKKITNKDLSLDEIKEKMSELQSMLEKLTN